MHAFSDVPSRSAHTHHTGDNPGHDHPGQRPRTPAPRHGHGPAHAHGHADIHREHGESSSHPRPARVLEAAGSLTSTSVTFASMHLAPPLLEALRDEQYTTPTPIQAQAIAPIMTGKDVLGVAQTGTGKTAAFALPILHRLLTQPVDKTARGGHQPRVLVLSPTRELATQIGDSFATYGRHTGMRHTVIFGGVGQHPQVQALRKGVDIIVATPGRLLDLMEQRLVDLTHIRVLVLDEADRMLDMGFIQPIKRIVAALPPKKPDPTSNRAGLQTLLFSATMPSEVSHLADALLREPVKVSVTPVSSAAESVAQTLYHVSRKMKQALLQHLLDTDPGIARAIVFTRTKHGADKVCKRLIRAGIGAQAIHGNKAQNQRVRALDAFASGRSRVLVATDVAARGLDVDGITHVFNFDLPNEPESYVHRIGRTGRAGATGKAIAFCDASDPDERDFLRDIEKLLKKKLPVVPTPQDLPELPGIAHEVEQDMAREERGREIRERKMQQRQTRRETHSRPQRADARGTHSPRPSHQAHSDQPHAVREVKPRSQQGQRAPHSGGSSHHRAGPSGSSPGFRSMGRAGKGKGRR